MSEVPQDFVARIESHKSFAGWANFAGTWDVGEDLEPCARYMSESEEWQRILERDSKPLPEPEHGG